MPADPVALLPVTQSDRDAVQAFHREMGARLMRAIRDPDAAQDLGNDEGDASPIHQAFARHRIAHRTPAPAGDREGLVKTIAKALAAKQIDAVVKGTGLGLTGISTDAREQIIEADYSGWLDEAEYVADALAASDSAVSGSAEVLREAGRICRETADRATHQLDREDRRWQPTRAHYEGLRNALRNAERQLAAALTEGQQS